MLKSFPSNSDAQPGLGTIKDTLTFFALMPSFTVTGTPGDVFSNHLSRKCDEVILRKKNFYSAY